ncbi:DeoR/GlpR family DNA-binding transcription regulator [Kitasatospora sp. NPDC006697]|uniref:DeoR/GlpR family DNA-binding transcription regulator n=1 Tax=Kitasatospora sp. NPDC006697 TaxID=3364020 RepID=UPI0036AA6CAB
MTTTDTGRGPALLTRQRRDHILADLRAHGAVRTGELSRRWVVSPMTIRRDLAVLEAGGGAVRVHGGAVSALGPEPGAGAGAGAGADGAVPGDAAVRALAAAAARTVQPGAAIGLSGGRAVEALAEELTQHENLTVVTNSLRVAAILDGTARRSPTVILTGGHLSHSGLLVGPLAVASLRTMRVNLAFVDCEGADLTGGLTVGDLADAELRARMLHTATRRILLAEPTVFGARALAPFATLREIDTVLTAPSPDGSGSAAREEVLRAIRGPLAEALPEGR